MTEQTPDPNAAYRVVGEMGWRLTDPPTPEQTPDREALREQVAEALWYSLLGVHRNGRAWTDCPPQHRPWWIKQADAVMDVLRPTLDRADEERRYLEARIDRADNATSAAMDERDEARAENERLRAETVRLRTELAAFHLRDRAALEGDTR